MSAERIKRLEDALWRLVSVAEDRENGYPAEECNELPAEAIANARKALLETK